MDCNFTKIKQVGFLLLAKPMLLKKGKGKVDMERRLNAIYVCEEVIRADVGRQEKL